MAICWTDMPSEVLEALAGLPEGFVVLDPCKGIGAASELWRAANVSVQFDMGCDVDPRLEKYYSELRKRCGESVRGLTGKFGPVEGDIMQWSADRIPDAHAIITGPPCQGWAAGGNHAGVQDERSAPFLHIVSWVEELARRQTLLFFLLENSPMIMNATGNLAPFGSCVLRRLQFNLPMFAVDVQIVKLERYVPHRRERAIVRGVRKDILGATQTIPSVMPSLGKGVPRLEDLLTVGERNLARWEVGTEKEMLNLYSYEERVREDVRQGAAGSVAVCDLSRSGEKTFSARLLYNCVPSLTTKGPEIFVFSVEDMGVSDTRSRRLFRYITEPERWELMGHPGSHAELAIATGGKTFAKTLSGNAWATPMLAAVMCPILHCVRESGVMGEKDLNFSGPLLRDEAESSAAFKSPEQPQTRARSRSSSSASSPSGSLARQREGGDVDSLCAKRVCCPASGASRGSGDAAGGAGMPDTDSTQSDSGSLDLFP